MADVLGAAHGELTRRILADVLLFAELGSGVRLRRYQEEAARAIVDSVRHGKGHSFVVLFPRQSGKNELQAQIEAYLLLLYSGLDGEIVKVSPTWRPQGLNAMRRLQRTLERNFYLRRMWKKEHGYIYRLNTARIYFLSGMPAANVVGATAKTLLECDEAQSVLPAKWDKDIAPMAASSNCTRVFWGTAWTSRTLLARELRAARAAEAADGQPRVFTLTADEVRREVPAYGRFVDEQVRRLGRGHPLVRTQYFSEEIDAESGMFPLARRALMQGDHPRQEGPAPGRVYALLVDVAGEDEGANGELQIAALGTTALSTTAGGLQNPGRDATALTVVEVDLAGLEDPGLRAPVYRVVDRRAWVGARHTTLYGQLLALFERWRAAAIVVDATGVGAGLCSFLARSLGSKVIAFEFNGSTKSKLGWDFLSIVETGRYREYVGTLETLQGEFWRQVEYCQMEILPGPERRMRWGVPDGTRDAATGELVHDDLILSAALCATLDGLAWGRAASAVLPGGDILEGMGEVF